MQKSGYLLLTTSELATEWIERC